MTVFHAQAPLPHAARRWQAVLLLLTAAPQFDRLPPWLLALMLLASLWHWVPLQRAIASIAGMLRVLLLIAGMAGVYYTHRTLFGPEGGVSFLLLCASLKVMESRQQRDAFISAILGFFIVATAFLFATSLLTTLYVALVTVLQMTALMQLQQPNASWSARFKKSGVMALQAVPILLVLFVFFPRLPPIWTLNFSQGSGRTGMSDSMSPGDIAKLSESAALAFRVEFEGDVPPLEERYWRGLVFSYFDGLQWRQAESILPPRPASSPAPWVDDSSSRAPYAYRISLEPSDQPWLFALAEPQSLTPKVELTRDNRLVADSPVFERFQYEVRSWPGAVSDANELPLWLRNQSLQLPLTGNEESRRFARERRLSAGSDAAFMQAMLQWFRSQDFFYTLEPPRLSSNRIDDFLFRTRRGFCEHYASAYVFLMRAAGIPARVVVGYQGGEKSSLDNYFVIRQLDAHAWAEVWLPGRGWVRVDPTSAVAPERVERGAAQAATNPAYWGDSGMSAVRYNQYRLLRQLRNVADYVNYRWTRDVLGYDVNRQDDFMQRLLGDGSVLKRIGVMFALLLAVAGFLFVWTLRRGRSPQHPLDLLYHRYVAKLAKRGVARLPHETPQQFAERVAKEQPVLADDAKAIATLYNALRYQSPTRRALLEQTQLLRRFKRLVRR